MQTWGGVGLVLCLALAGCAREASRGETQPGSAGDQAASAERARDAGCDALPDEAELQRLLRQAPSTGGEAGGLFSGRREWAALVDRDGRVCASAASLGDPAAVWPGSQAVAKAKAYTANAFSADDMPLSTARLYTLTQPGHSLWGVAQPNAFAPACLVAPADHRSTDGELCGGSIAFGGGVALYRAGIRVGGLGVSGDTACADHEIAKRIRTLAGLDPEAGPAADDITFTQADGPTPFSHPLCANTWRNGVKVGDEAPAAGY